MLIYLLKSATCLAIFMAFYKFFLEKENMHVFKRFYLLCALITAFGIPFITFTQYIEVAPMPTIYEAIPAAIVQPETISQPVEVNYVPIVLWSLYFAGLVLFATKFLLNLFQILFKIHGNPKQASKSIIYVLLTDFITPHTFFNYIFLNKKKFEQREIPQEVFWHEETHAKQKHSIDVLFVEFLQVIFWFNPLIYYVKHAVKMNHEFLADQAVLNKGVAASTYQHILLAFSSPDGSLNTSESPLANAINYSSTRHAISAIKKRFTVMKTHPTKRKIWLKSILLLPLLALTLYGFSEKKDIVKPIAKQNMISDTQDSSVQVNEISAENMAQEPYYTILLNKKGKFLVNDHLGTLQVIENDFKAIAADKTKSKTIVFRYEIDTPLSDIASVMYMVEKYNLTAIQWPPEDSAHINKVQTEATPSEVEEYNKLSKFYNDQSDDNRVIKLADMRRHQEIYKKMTEEQKSKAESQPNPPPPPPPPPAKDPLAQMEANKKNHENSRKQGYYTYPHKNEKGEVSTVKIKVLETNANKDIVLLETWYITIGNKKYYYSYKGDLKKYYDKYGKEVDLDIVKEYQKQNEQYEKLKGEGQPYVNKTEKDKKEIEQLFSDLGGMYYRMTTENKRKVNPPTLYKKQRKLTEEKMNRISPPVKQN